MASLFSDLHFGLIRLTWELMAKFLYKFSGWFWKDGRGGLAILRQPCDTRFHLSGGFFLGTHLRCVGNVCVYIEMDKYLSITIASIYSKRMLDDQKQLPPLATCNRE